MNIGEAARASGITAKMIRYYESVDLIPPAGRTEAGYRTYGERDVDTLRFIRRARDFGMPMDRVKLLVGLWQDKDRPSREVKAIALSQVAALEAKIAELTAMKDALAELARACHGDNRPDCPILSDLAGASFTSAHPGPDRRSGKAGQRFAGKRLA
ncbi:MAG: Cu(I)-responsive transcriptional regulator [Rhodopila sp.]|nr:Cu(I)-responsive transcriptional regulator [Rhodopila sp.]